MAQPTDVTSPEPVATPAPAPEPAATPDRPEDTASFADVLADDFDNEDVTPEPAVVVAPEPTGEAVPAEPQAVPAPVSQKEPEPIRPPASAEPQPVAATPVAPAPAVAAPVQPPTPVPTAEQMKARRDALIDDFAKQFRISEEDAAVLATEPEKVLPRIAAQATVSAFEAVISTMRGMLPQMFENFTQEREARKTYRNSFYATWPQLDKPEYATTVRQVAETFGQLHPNATPEQAIKAIGVQAAYMLGVPLDMPASAPAPVSAPAMPKPFTPASPGASGSVRPAGTPANIFEELALFEESFDN